MTEHTTFLPATADDAVAHLRSRAIALSSAERERALAVAAVREAVMAARLMKVSWDAIGNELGVSRQAATERFGGDVRAHLVSAWFGIERLLSEIAATRRYDGRPMEMLEQLQREGVIPTDLLAGAHQLYEARNRAVHSTTSDMTATETDRLTDVAIPLVGMLWLHLHANDSNGEDAAG